VPHTPRPREWHHPACPGAISLSKTEREKQSGEVNAFPPVHQAHRNRLRRWWRWAALALLLAGALGLDLTLQPALRSGAASSPTASLAFELAEGRSLAQEFVATRPLLAEIALVTARPLEEPSEGPLDRLAAPRGAPPPSAVSPEPAANRAPAGALVLRLVDEEDTQVLRTVRLDLARLPAGDVWSFIPTRTTGQWTVFRFAPLAVVPGRRYRFTVEAPGVSGDAPVRVLVQFPPQYHGGYARIDGRPVGGTLLFRTAYRTSLLEALAARQLAGIAVPWAVGLALLCLAGALGLLAAPARQLWRARTAGPVGRLAPRAGAVLAIALCAGLAGSHLRETVPWLVEQMAATRAAAALDPAAKLRLRWGRTAALAELVRQQTPPDAVVMLPPGPAWGPLGSPFILQYFLLPRRVTLEQRALVEQTPPPVTHLLMVQRRAPSPGAPPIGWPRFWVPASRVVFAPRTRMVDVAELALLDPAGAVLLRWTPAAALPLVRWPGAAALARHLAPPPGETATSALLLDEPPGFQQIVVTYTASRPDVWGLAVPPQAAQLAHGRLVVQARWPEGADLTLVALFQAADGTLIAVESPRLSGAGAWQTVAVDLARPSLPALEGSRLVWVGLDLGVPPVLPYRDGWGVLALARGQEPDPRRGPEGLWTAAGWLAAGHAALARGDLAAALDRYLLARALAPDDAAVYLALTEALRRAGRLEAALAAAQTAAALAPEEPWSHYALGRVLEARGQPAAALAAYERAAELAPAEPWTQLAAGRLLEAAGAGEAARQRYRLAAAMYPYSADAVAAAWVLRRPAP
jgi:hypothetical protein